MIAVYCPICGKKLFNYSNKSTNNLSMKCRNCNILVTRYADGTVKTGKVPERNTASGMRFY